MEYRVVYVIDVDAHSPRAAAKEAHACMTDPDSQPPHFYVAERSGQAPSGTPIFEPFIEIDLSRKVRHTKSDSMIRSTILGYPAN